MIIVNTMQKKLFICLWICISLPFTLSAQEALKSVEEEYYDFLSLQGLAERPALNYRTLSDSVWAVDETAEHPWKGINLGTFHSLSGDFRLRAYGPELFMSGNTAAPYGQNDGVLWQGRGFNALFKGGARLEGYGVELTLLPHLAFSQNADFEIMPSAYENEYGYIWGYAYNIGVDAPQRFGNKPFFDWDFGDSEIRYTWKTFTVGFGTQAIWLGPSQINSIIHSNNAPAYPKIDIGLRRQQITLPWINWYMGDIELRLWIGQLQESYFFDSDNNNNLSLITGLSFAFAPSFLPGFSIYFNRTYRSNWERKSALTLLEVWHAFRSAGGDDIWDQHLTAGFNYLLPTVGFNLYAEIGYNDTPANNIHNFIKNFSHTIAFTAGIKKGMSISSAKNIHAELLFEYTHLEMSPFYSQTHWSNTFYMHHEIIHGYTNRGQWLGAGIGTGGNSQYLGFKVYYTKGFFNIFFYRYNPDNDFLMRETTPIQGYPPEKIIGNVTVYPSEKAIFTVGLESNYFITKNISLLGEIAFCEILNYAYGYDNLHNMRLAIGVKVFF